MCFPNVQQGGPCDFCLEVKKKKKKKIFFQKINYNFLPCLVRDIVGYFRVDSAGIFRAPLFLDIFVICRGNGLSVRPTHQPCPPLFSSVLLYPVCSEFLLLSLFLSFFFNHRGKKKKEKFIFFFFKKQVEKGINFEAALNDSPKWQRPTPPLKLGGGRETSSRRLRWRRGEEQKHPRMAGVWHRWLILSFQRKLGCGMPLRIPIIAD